VIVAKNFEQKKNDETDLSFWKRILFGFPNQIYFFARFIYLMLIVPKSFFAPNPQNPSKQAVVFIYGLFGNRYQFFDYKRGIERECNETTTYFYTYRHGRSLSEDIEDLAEYLKNIDRSLTTITLIGHSRGGVMGYHALQRLASVDSTRQYQLITLAAPLHGAELAYKISSLMNKKGRLWAPLKAFFKLLFWILRAQHIREDFSIDLIGNFQPSFPIHHLVAKYDVISGPDTQQRIDQTLPSTTIRCCHAGILFSKAAVQETALLVKNGFQKSGA
jgi:hypothetical protein